MRALRNLANSRVISNLVSFIVWKRFWQGSSQQELNSEGRHCQAVTGGHSARPEQSERVVCGAQRQLQREEWAVDAVQERAGGTE